MWNAHVDADAHYHREGWHEGRDPNAFFSTSTYLSINPDVKAAGVDPLIHFHQFGWSEGRAPSINFDDAAYLAANPDVKAAHIDPLTHFLQYGAQEGRQPTRSIICWRQRLRLRYYLQHNPMLRRISDPVPALRDDRLEGGAQSECAVRHRRLSRGLCGRRGRAHQPARPL